MEHDNKSMEDTHSNDNNFKKIEDDEYTYLTHVNRKNFWKINQYISKKSAENLRGF